MYCYILKLMNLIECDTSINNHIINLNYIFLPEYSWFSWILGWGMDWCADGWVCKMMCVWSKGDGMGTYERIEECMCASKQMGRYMRMKCTRMCACNICILHVCVQWAKSAETPQNRTKRKTCCPWHLTRTGEGITTTKTHKTRPHGQNCHSKWSKQNMQKKQITKISAHAAKRTKKKHTHKAKKVYLALKTKAKTSSNNKTIDNAATGHKLQQQKTPSKIGQILAAKK